MQKKQIIAGTRGSILAVAQATYVVDLLKVNNPAIEFSLKKIKTSGDINQSVSLTNNSLKNMFIKEIEVDLLAGNIDLAVHSMKDMPTLNTPGLLTAAIPVREDHRDVYISRGGMLLQDLKPGSVIGTGSIRRQIQMTAMRDDLEIKDIRGNIHTRLAKLENEDYDAIILAAAGLNRVGLSHIITEYFEVSDMLSAPAQGALCIQCREDDDDMIRMLDAINDPETQCICTAEREFSRIFEGGCKVPIGAYGRIEGELLTLYGMTVSNNRIYKNTTTGPASSPEKTALVLANIIKDAIYANHS